MPSLNCLFDKQQIAEHLEAAGRHLPRDFRPGHHRTPNITYVDCETDIPPLHLYRECMAEQVKIIEIALIRGDVLVTFSDGRITHLDADDIHAQFIEAPPYPDSTSGL